MTTEEGPEYWAAFSKRRLLYVVTYTIEEMNRHFAADGSDEPDPEDLVKNALDAYDGGAR
jgi:hypothetical protein